MKYFYLFVKRLFCKHKNKFEIFRYYPDRYVIDHCPDCGKDIWTDL